MLRRVIPLVRSLPSVTRLQTVRFKGSVFDEPPAWKTDKELAIENRTSMNDMQVPAGPWEDQYNKRNSRFNILLTGSAVFCIATWILAVGLGATYFHETPPISGGKRY